MIKDFKYDYIVLNKIFQKNNCFLSLNAKLND